MEAPEWYVIANVSDLDTPALVVYPDRVKYNIELVKTMIDDISRLRPHVKTHKSLDVTGLMLSGGITKFKCATIAEAEMLGMANAPDVLLAYQPAGPKLKRFINLIQRYPGTRYCCLVDNIASANAIANEAVSASLTIDVYIDLNVGMNRTGVKPDREALNLYAYCLILSGLNVKGLHAYDGHIHDADYAVRQQKSDTCMRAVYELADQVVSELNAPKPIIIAGGSPTYPVLAQVPGLECSPGTFAYWDRGYQLAFPEQTFKTAAVIVARIISLPDSGKICIDVGHKSVSAENELSKRIYFLNAPDLIFVSQSEEHLVAEAGEGHSYQVGDVLYGLPYHVCPSIALYERAITVVDHTAAGEWKNIARDRTISV